MSAPCRLMKPYVKITTSQIGSMKVIMAGYSKTGTKTMCTALTMLGYKTYDFFEHYTYHGDIWNRILTSGGTINDFEKMYEDVDAVTDAPAYYFWEQIHEAFPDAKIILTIRDEDSWFKSYKRQRMTDKTLSNFLTFAPCVPLFEWVKLMKYGRNAVRVVLGNGSVNEMVSRIKYRQHNCYVKQTAPKDKLLVYRVSDEWEPLCKFLDKDIPNVAFPHKNSNCSVAEELANENPIAIANQKQNKRHLLALLGFFFVIVAVWWSWC